MQKLPLDDERIFVIREFFSPEECAAAIARAESLGFSDAPITMGDGAIVLKEFRSNLRVMIDDAELAASLFERAKPLLPESMGEWVASGLNERFRFYRYDIGHCFAAHFDGCFHRDSAEESKLTFMIYLNDNLTGGTTDFMTDAGTVWMRVRPLLGMALVFEHAQLHEGTPPTSGRKYVLRTDVMYRRSSWGAASP